MFSGRLCEEIKLRAMGQDTMIPSGLYMGTGTHRHRHMCIYHAHANIILESKQNHNRTTPEDNAQASYKNLGESGTKMDNAVFSNMTPRDPEAH